VASDGLEGVNLFRQHPGTISVILLDMTMPVMNGEGAFRLIRQIDPYVPIMISTGYSETATRDLFALGAWVGFIQKPYTAALLVQRVRAASNAGNAGGTLKAAG
jgi:CheY-like chemotaxis protein